MGPESPETILSPLGVRFGSEIHGTGLGFVWAIISHLLSSAFLLPTYVLQASVAPSQRSGFYHFLPLQGSVCFVSAAAASLKTNDPGSALTDSCPQQTGT